MLRERFNKWKAKNPERWKWLIQQRRFRSYGLFQHEYEEMFMEQDGCCAICEEPFDRTPHIDHDHETDEVRGLLCTGCNTGLGKFMDSPSLLVAAVRYLLRHMNGK